jgi:serine phosphatase RsbU (regulator of sigma subunit)
VHRAFRKDLEGAKDVQQAFFPPQSFSIPCLSCETFYQPARGIGGDYYDFLSLSGGRWGIAIGDVSGKGIGAALLMASLQASLRAQALHPHSDLTALIGDVKPSGLRIIPNGFLCVTLLCGVQAGYSYVAIRECWP